MTLSPRQRMIRGFVLANAAIIVIVAVVFFNQPASPPIIQGVLLLDARDLPPFSLQSHHGQVFTRDDLYGQWHIISYGFTTCPDICPTTLAQLAEVKTRLADHDDNLRIIFYTVDHKRDTVSQIAAYVPFFHPEFIGLTHGDDPYNPHLPFEKGLGIAAQLTPIKGETAYSVSHGVTLFVLNPLGQLQAILKPGTDRHGNKAFEANIIYKDFLLVRDYFGYASSTLTLE